MTVNTLDDLRAAKSTAMSEYLLATSMDEERKLERVVLVLGSLISYLETHSLEQAIEDSHGAKGN